LTAARGTEPHARGRAHLGHPAAQESSTPGNEAGHTVVELLVVLLITLIVLAAVQQATRVAHLLHAREVRRTERSTLALRAVEDMAREIEKAGFGLGGDVVAVVPGAPGGSLSSDGISIRSNPEGLIGVLQSDVRPGGERAVVSGAELFRPGDRVFLTDTSGPPVPATVTAADSRTLTLRDSSLPAWPPRRTILADRAGRVRPYREVSYFPLEVPGEERPVLARTIDGGEPAILARGVERLRFEYRDDAGRLLSPVRFPRAGPRFVGIHLELGQLRELPAVETSVTLPVHGGSIAFDEKPIRLRLRQLMWPVTGAVDVGSLRWAEIGWVLFRDNINGGSRAVSYVLEKNVRDPRVGSVLDLPDVRPPRGLVPEMLDAGCPGCLWLAAEGATGLEAWRLHPDAYGTTSNSSRLEKMLLASEVHDVRGVAAGFEERTLFVAERRFSSVLRVRVGPVAKEPIVEKLADLRSRPAALASGYDGSLWLLVERERASDPGTTLVEIRLDGEGRPRPARPAARFWGDPKGLAVDPIRGWLYVLVRELDDYVLYELTPECLGPGTALPRRVFSLKAWTDEVMHDPNILFRVVDTDQVGSDDDSKEAPADEAGDQATGKTGGESGETGTGGGGTGSETGGTGGGTGGAGGGSAGGTGAETGVEGGGTGEQGSEAGSSAGTGKQEKKEEKKKEPKKKPKLLVLPTRLGAVAFDGGGSLYLMGEDTAVVLRFHLGRQWVARTRAFMTGVPVLDTDGGRMRLRLLGWALRPGAGTP